MPTPTPTAPSSDALLPFPETAWPKLRAALQHIADHPSEFYMGTYIVRLSAEHTSPDDVRRLERMVGGTLPACGTVACLAGRITLMDDPDAVTAHTGSALMVLGLSGAILEEDDEGPIKFSDPISQALHDVFLTVRIHTYAELADTLNETFTFPEALPSSVPA